jgi:HEPN domain-containing protein
MDSEQDVRFRLRLAEGFLQEAEQDLTLSRWRSCVDNAQLAVENAVKAVLARHGPVPKTHEVARPLTNLQRLEGLDATVKEKLTTLQELAERLSYEEHIRSDYGEEATFKTPWELFDEDDAQEAVQVARQTLALAKEILQGRGETGGEVSQEGGVSY